MKHRSGFVSNSSSTSFIIALRKISKACPHCSRKDPDFIEIIEQSSNYRKENHVNKIIEKNDASSYLFEMYYSDMFKEEYENLEKAVKEHVENSEWTVADISLYDHDRNLHSIMNNLIVSGNAEILHRSE